MRKPLTTSFSPLVMKLGTHNVPKNQHGNNAKGREVIRCEYGCTADVWASSRGRGWPRGTSKKRHGTGWSQRGRPEAESHGLALIAA